MDELNKLANQAIQLHTQGRAAEAARLYEQILAANPRHFDALHGLAVLRGQSARLDEALRLMDDAVAVEPDSFLARYNRGRILEKLNRLPEAAAGYGQAILLRPDFAEAHNNRAAVLRRLKQYREALASCERAIAFSPGHAEAHSNRGNMLRILERYDEALASCDRAIALRADLAAAHFIRGDVLAEFGRYAEAEASFDTAIALRPCYAEAYNSRANVLRGQGRWQEALVSYDHAVACEAYCPEILYNKSGLLLLMGDFRAGWPLGEWRWKTAQFRGRQRDFRQPPWDGDAPIAGKTVLLYNEQGLGDTVQFARYVPLVEALGAQVILEVPAPLIPLLRTLKGRARLIAHGEPLPEFDLHCSLMSLPLALHTTLETIPAEIPYLFADPVIRGAWRDRLGERRRPRIGLAWSGNPTYPNDRNRSLPLRLLAPYLSRAFEYHVVQKDIRPDDESILRDAPHLHCHEAALTDFAETAALIMEMDLILSVDTSIAHVAGALGKPVWVLLPFHPDWRWLTDRSDSPWYPTARLFRQPAPGDWGGALIEMRDALAGAGLT